VRASDAFFAIAQNQEERWVLLRVNLDGKSRVLLELTSPWGSFVTPSPDGRRLAYATLTTESNVWLLADF